MAFDAAEQLIATGHALMALIGGTEQPASWMTVLLATLAAAAIAGCALAAWLAGARRVAAQAVTRDDPLSPWTTGAALMRALTPLLAMAALLLTASPLLTRVVPAQAAFAAWIASAAGLVLAARSAVQTVEAIAARLHALSLRTTSSWDDLLVDLARQVARTIVIIGALYAGASLLLVPDRAQGAVDAGLDLAVIALIAWLFVALVGIGDRFLQQRFRIDVADNLQARRVYTQLMVMRRLAYLLIGVLAIALALMQFDGIRRIGTSILASAGLAGVILGFAAQRTLANLLAGIQIALSQPLRIDDAVIMEGEFGRIEEITLTYVVVAVWDQRRLIIPLSRIIENPFQNWTRTGSQLLGTVTMRCDFQVPLDAMRAEAKRLVEADHRWDRRVFGLQVTDWAERTVEVRVLLSANDSGALFDLRCAIREALLRWLRETAPAALPLVRVAGGPQTAAVAT